VKLWGYYSYLWTEELKADGSYGRIGDLSDHKLWFGATARYRQRFTATLRGRAMGARIPVDTNPLGQIGGYLVGDAAATAENLGAQGVSLTLRIDNLFDTHYSHPGIRTADSGEIPGHWEGDDWIGSAGYYNSKLPQPGRRVMLTLGLAY
jgi:outer membrane receptor protein involved in Fe transport